MHPKPGEMLAGPGTAGCRHCRQLCVPGPDWSISAPGGHQCDQCAAAALPCPAPTSPGSTSRIFSSVLRRSQPVPGLCFVPLFLTSVSPRLRPLTSRWTFSLHTSRPPSPARQPRCPATPTAVTRCSPPTSSLTTTSTTR